MNTEQIFAYPDLERAQKLELERALNPYDLGLVELAHLLSTPFPLEGRTRRWLERYVELGKIHRQQGPLPDLEQTMSRWATKQRSNRNQNRLSLGRERALNRIGFVWNVNEAMWQKQYNDYLAYQNDPQAKMGKSLGSWMCATRKKWDRLTPRQQRLLLEAGLVRQPFAEKAKIGLQELEDVFARQGNLRGLKKKLQHFVTRLRQRFHRGKLDPEVQKRCDRIGLKWLPQGNPEARWSSYYARAVAYVQHASTARPPVWKWPDRELSQWVGRQTGHWGKLSDKRKQLSFRSVRPVLICRPHFQQIALQQLVLEHRQKKVRLDIAIRCILA